METNSVFALDVSTKVQFAETMISKKRFVFFLAASVPSVDSRSTPQPYNHITSFQRRKIPHLDT
jgi:hypothetical protein